SPPGIWSTLFDKIFWSVAAFLRSLTGQRCRIGRLEYADQKEADFDRNFTANFPSGVLTEQTRTIAPDDSLTKKMHLISG
ncbi:hypothetical protein, partial [Hyphomonas sp. BRH_c22]|uniref:hypothetical protein n=1 Tax=Hyphomonas sp. BRH_c22 TaxID=1629710 RepID=UPI0026283DCC